MRLQPRFTEITFFIFQTKWQNELLKQEKWYREFDPRML